MPLIWVLTGSAEDNGSDNGDNEWYDQGQETMFGLLDDCQRDPPTKRINIDSPPQLHRFVDSKTW